MLITTMLVVPSAARLWASALWGGDNRDSMLILRDELLLAPRLGPAMLIRQSDDDGVRSHGCRRAARAAAIRAW